MVTFVDAWLTICHGRTLRNEPDVRRTIAFMERWTCPGCNRVFAKKNQSHLVCEEAPTLEEHFGQAKSWEQPIFRAIESHFSKNVGEMIVDPLPIGILLKNGPMFAELRSKTKWLAIGFHLPRKLESIRLSRKVIDVGKKHFHVINAASPDVVDDQLLEWLTEAYHLAGGTRYERGLTPTFATKRREGSDPDHFTHGDGMVPDDVDDLF